MARYSIAATATSVQGTRSASLPFQGHSVQSSRLQLIAILG
jgi:hypothetical protein